MKCCGGLPLAIDTLGSMMRLKNDEVEWKAVLDCEIWKMQAAKDNILPALRLSYNHLPSHLKQCFAFCAIYPKDHEMERDTLIQLWMANGYIPSNGKGDLEAVGRDIVDELVWRSFFQNVKQVSSIYSEDFLCEYRDRVTYKMHDLMHDLAQSIMGKECLNFAHDPKWEDIPSTARHLPVPYFPVLKSSLNQPILPTIRTIVWQYKLHNQPELSIMYPSMLKSLRVWVFMSSHELFDKTVSVRHFRHLRLLDLSYSRFLTELPEFICSLYNLQTLNLSRCLSLKKLPDNLTDLVHLRHLYLNDCHKLVHMPRGMGRLKQLNVLTKYVVSAKAERGLEQLCDLNLSGNLELSRIEKVSNAIDAKTMNLSSKLNLYSIMLSWDEAGSLEVFEALKPHDGLRKLVISGYMGRFPEWMNVLQKLEVLVIQDCDGLVSLPERMESLVILKIFNCNGLTSLPEGLPKLQKLYISVCQGLTSLPKTILLQLPSLTSLTIVGHSELIRPFQFGGEYEHLIEDIHNRDIRHQDLWIKTSS